MKQRLVLSLLAVALLPTMLAACSSSSKKSASTGGSTTESTAKAPTGAPIKVMLIGGTGAGTNGDEDKGAADAAVAEINAHGGIQGRPLSYEFCDSHTDPNEAGACARKAVANADIVATVGNDSYAGGPAIDPVLSEAGLPAVGTSPYTSPDFNTAGVFNISGGGLSIVAAQNMFPIVDGKKKVAALIFDNPGGAQAAGFVNSILTKLFQTQLTVVKVPTTATDMTSFVAEAIRSKPDAVSLALQSGLALSAVQQLRSQGFDKTIVMASTAATPDVLKQLGDSAGDLDFVGAFSYTNPAHDQFVKDIAKHSPNISGSDSAFNAWLAFTQFSKVMSKPGADLSRKGVLAAYNALADYSTDGATPNLNYTVTGPASFTRLFNPTSTRHVIKGGKLVDKTPTTFINVLSGKTSTR